MQAWPSQFSSEQTSARQSSARQTSEIHISAKNISTRKIPPEHASAGTFGDLYLTLADDVMNAGLGKVPTATKKLSELLA